MSQAPDSLGFDTSFGVANEPRMDYTRTRLTEALQEQHGIYHVDLVAEVREERDRDMERVWGDEE